MALYLVADGQYWRLSGGVDGHKLRETIRDGMEAGTPHTLEVHVALDPGREATVLLLNLRAIGQAAVVDLKESPAR